MPASQSWNYSLAAALLLMAPFDLLASLGMDMYLPVVPRMPCLLVTTPEIVQLTLSLYLLTLGGGQLVFGPLSDRFGRRPVLLAGALLFAVASAALASTSSSELFLALRVAQATGGAASLVATFATVRDVYAARPEGATIYGLFTGMLAFVPAIGPLLGALVERFFGWRSIFLLLSLLGCAAGLRALLSWPETRVLAHRRIGLAHLREILANASFWTYTVGGSAAMGAFFVYFSTASRILVTRVGLSSIAFSLVFATSALVMIAASRWSARIVARWGERGCLIRGMAFLLVGAALLLLNQMSAVPSVLGFIGPVWVISIGISITCAVVANGALRPFGHVAGTATAIHSFVESFIVTGAGTLTVVLAPAETAWPLIAFCMVSATVTLTLAYLNRHKFSTN